ncbi:MAG TPA: CHAD domain-containing protein [Stellaceae bacterium]|nr:CHAD domain-containing protein [Stellaceae bacterium]
MDSGREIELKLSVRPDRLERVMRSPHLQGDGARRAIARALKNIYYDTPHLALRERGLVVRVREAGRRYIQTVKASGSAGPSGLFNRHEWERPVAGPKPDLAGIDDPSLRRELGATATQLAPVFSSEVNRITRTVQHGETDRIEVAIDQGRVMTPRGSAPICEIELELKQGKPEALFDLALALNQETPVRLETLSKSDRGYAILTEDAIGWSKAPPVVLDPAMTGSQAFETILRHNLTHMLTNERAAREGHDPEGVHQVRLAARRLRSVLSLFRSVVPAETVVTLTEELKWLAGEISAARDLDVFLDELLLPVQEAFAEDADLAALKAMARDRRGIAYEQVRAAFATQRYTALLLQIGRLIESRAWQETLEPLTAQRLAEPARIIASDLLSERYRKVRKRGRGFGDLTAKDRHRLRLGVKKLRYAAECFRSLFEGEGTPGYLKSLSRLQDSLGYLNDVETARDLLTAFDTRNGSPQAAALTRASGLVIGWYQRGAKELESKQRKQWKQFRSDTPFWTENGLG